MTTLFRGIVSSLVLACSPVYNTYNNETIIESSNISDAGIELDSGDDMSLAKSATGQLVSRGTSIISIQDDFDGEAQNFTVQFSISARSAVNGGPFLGNITPVAEIEWALGGNNQRRLVSVFDGTAVTGVAEHFTIRVTDQTDPNDGTNQTQYNVTVTAARGVRGSTALPPTYQTYIQNAGLNKLGTFNLGPGANIILPIPQNAGINSVMVTADSIGVLLTGIEFDFEQSNPAGTLKRYNPMNYNFVSISPQADRIIFTNLTGGPGITLEFSVTWGIDG